MMAMEGVEAKKNLSGQALLRMFGGMAVGAGFGAGFITLLVHLHVSIKALTWSDLGALWLGITFLGVGLAIYLVSFHRLAVARNLEGMEAKLPATDEEVKAVRLQAVTLVLAGVMLLLPVLAMGSLGKAEGAPPLVFAGIAVLFLLQTAANVQLWLTSDEFLRRQMLLAGGITFAIGQGLLFLWAAAEHLHLVHALSSWDTIVLLMGLYLLTGSYLGIRSRMSN